MGVYLAGGIQPDGPHRNNTQMLVGLLKNPLKIINFESWSQSGATGKRGTESQLMHQAIGSSCKTPKARPRTISPEHPHQELKHFR